MDKFTLTGFDRKYAFVCELSALSSSNSNLSPSLTTPTLNVEDHEIRRRPISPTNGLWDKSILSVTSITPIIPQNAPKG